MGTESLDCGVDRYEPQSFIHRARCSLHRQPRPELRVESGLGEVAAQHGRSGKQPREDRQVGHQSNAQHQKLEGWMVVGGGRGEQSSSGFLTRKRQDLDTAWVMHQGHVLSGRDSVVFFCRYQRLECTSD